MIQIPITRARGHVSQTISRCVGLTVTHYPDTPSCGHIQPIEEGNQSCVTLSYYNYFAKIEKSTNNILRAVAVCFHVKSFYKSNC